MSQGYCEVSVEIFMLLLLFAQLSEGNNCNVMREA